MISITHFMFCKHSRCVIRIWLAIGISLSFCAASAETYPISGVWVAKNDDFPGSTAGACLLLKEFGVDVPSTQPFPRVMIFSGDQRFEMHGNFYAKSTIRSVEGVIGGGYKITETLDKRWYTEDGQLWVVGQPPKSEQMIAIAADLLNLRSRLRPQRLSSAKQRSDRLQLS